MSTLPDMEQWLVDANEALNITLLAPSESGLTNIATFHPKFTYPIFGDEEKIFGYKDLKINLRYRANDMRPHLQTSYSKKLKPQGEDEPTDIVGTLEGEGHLPKIAFAQSTDFESSAKQMGHDWQPPGTLHSTIDDADGQYEIWRGTLTDPAVRQLNSRVQIFVPLFIEGGSYIGQDPEPDSAEREISDADRWTVFYLYRKQKASDSSEKDSYAFMGYSTVYRFFYFQRPTPPSSPKQDWELPTGTVDLGDLPCRTRLSQFMILPPFQGKGHGARLYNTIFEYYHKHSQTLEFTVENPNEAFDDLRDICDLGFLRSVPEFNTLAVDTTITLAKKGPIPKLVKGHSGLEAIRLKAKIAPRQFARVLEMHLMSQLPASVQSTMSLDAEVPTPTEADKHQEKLWQLIVKQRLYRHNRDLLSQIEPIERIGKLDEAFGAVELEYARLLAAYERSRKHSQAKIAASGKRKTEEADDAVPSKRAKLDA